MTGKKNSKRKLSFNLYSSRTFLFGTSETEVTWIYAKGEEILFYFHFIFFPPYVSDNTLPIYGSNHFSNVTRKRQYTHRVY